MLIRCQCCTLIGCYASVHINYWIIFAEDLNGSELLACVLYFGFF